MQRSLFAFWTDAKIVPLRSQVMLFLELPIWLSGSIAHF